MQFRLCKSHLLTFYYARTEKIFGVGSEKNSRDVFRLQLTISYVHQTSFNFYHFERKLMKMKESMTRMRTDKVKNTPTSQERRS
ncbi:hypothetical protein P8452_67756 [Trifolium repens]|nr:hypothetical protein P8452_67756 [Trifolium repens]